MRRLRGLFGRRNRGAREALLISGERPGTMQHIRGELERRGYSDFWDFACQVADRCASAGLFPHGNFGRMTEEELVRIRPHFVSMGMMLESVKDDSECAPEKRWPVGERVSRPPDGPRFHSPAGSWWGGEKIRPRDLSRLKCWRNFIRSMGTYRRF